MSVIDLLDTYAGRVFGWEELESRVRMTSIEQATYLRPANLLTLIEEGESAEEVKQYFRRTLYEHRESLVVALAELGRYPPRILQAIGRVPRHLCLPASSAALSYWNGANIVQGTIAVPAPWLAAYSSFRLGIQRGSRVLVFGFGYGFCSLVFAELTGDAGQVIAVELDRNCVNRGRALIEALEVRNISIVHGDALRIDRDLGRFDSIWSSLSTCDVPKAWVDLLVDSGTLGLFVDPVKSSRPSKSRAKDKTAKAGLCTSVEDRWWENVSFVVYSLEDTLIEKFQMKGLVNPPFDSGRGRRRGRSVLYADLGNAEQRFLRLLPGRPE